ncbi:MAG: FtsX-like permease family protein [Aerococcus sp.]|nr:FtsX-like permease family protein [Aerococcus sp.]
MTKKTLWKETYREIFSKVLRFLALVGIIMLGTGFFVGIRSAAPDMRQTSSNYYNQKQLEDLSLSATFGLSDKDEDILAAIPGIDYRKEQYVDVENPSDNGVMRIYPMTDSEDFNQFDLVDGRLPKAPDEIAVDTIAPEISGDYAIGKTITYETAKDQLPDSQTEHMNDLKHRKYKIVGTVRSPKFISHDTNRGYTAIGKGTIDAMAVVQPNEIKGGQTNAYAIRLTQDRSNMYDAAYQDSVNAKKDEIEDAFADRQDEVTKQVKQDARDDLNAQKDKLAQAKQTLETQKQALDGARGQLHEAQAAYQAKLNQAWQAFPSGQAPVQVTAPLQQIEQQLQQTEATLNEKQSQFDAQAKAFDDETADAEQEIKDGEAQIDQLPSANYQVEPTATSGPVEEYGSNADRVAAIARVFPWLFFLVAAMVSFTTMTRMVDEQRTQMGTMKAFGYSNGDIVRKYVIYAGAACAIGSIVGIGIGNYLFPNIIYTAYQLLYELPDINYQWVWTDILMTAGIAILTSVVPAAVTAWRSLNVHAAELMRPKPPKQGEHIFIERWQWFWNRLSFMSKITLRNLFRYKWRNSMTAIGIIGCTALIVTGFAISDSVVDVPDQQFDVIENYDAGIGLTDNLSDADIDAVEQEVADKAPKDANVLPLHIETYRSDQEGQKVHDVNVNVLNPDSQYRDFYQLASKTDDKRLTLPNEGALVTEKIARLLDLSVGDEITLKDDQGERVSFPIRGIVRNYISHNVFVTEDTYQETTGETVMPNQLNVQMAMESTAEQDQFSKDLMDDERIRTIYFTQTIKDNFGGTLDTLSEVTVVLIVAAALLAFIVLYSLQSVNVSERMQELSTIKVLGMYPEEVTGYLYRETFLLTIIGIVIGLISGYFLTDYIMKTIEIDQMVFPTRISPSSYLYSIGLTLLFSIIVMLIIHRRLKKIDMVEALKGSE